MNIEKQNDAQHTISKATLARAIEALQKTRQKLEALEAARHEPIAIIGMGCHYPGGSDTPERFWQNLLKRFDAIIELPEERAADLPKHRTTPSAAVDGREQALAAYARRGGFLAQVDQFDPLFFGLSPREVIVMDPAHRLLLETAWEALEDANLVPSTIFNTEIGVFIGAGSSGYINFGSEQSSDLYAATGNAVSTAAGRISYLLGITGPCMVVDTACSSSLLAIHLACQSLRNGECQAALAGGVNLLLDEEVTAMFAHGNMMAPDARCKTFDATADGYGRGEGCGIIVLKRLSDALADQDLIRAVIRGTAINQDGPSGGLTVPNGPAQERVIQRALADAQLKPEQVTYIEAHGTGTPLGDPIEIGALSAVFKERTAPLWVGSVKTNIGHLEFAAGVAGLMKLVLALQHGVIPPHLHLHRPNPHIDWASASIQVPTSVTPWLNNGEAQARIGGVSAFGFSGTNAHIIVAEAPGAEKVVQPVERSAHLLTLSAKDEPALRAYAQRYHDFLVSNPAVDLGDFCYTAHIGRSHFAQRLSMAAASREEMQTQLAAYAQGRVDAGRKPTGLCQGVVAPSQATKAGAGRIAFLFTGQGSQYVDMGRELYTTQPTFRATLDRCDAVLRDCLGRSLIELLYPPTPPTHNDLLTSHPCGQAANFALECALADLWRAWGVQPALVLGHSLGDFAAAYTAGVFTLEDGLRLVTERGRLMETAIGSMVAVLASETEVMPFLAAFADVTIGVINGPKSVVISGGQSSVACVTDALQAAGFKTRKLEIPVAAHSPLLNPVLDAFEAAVRRVKLAPPQITVISSMTGQVVTTELTNPAYWRQQLRNTVRFADGVATLRKQDGTIFLEIGPKPTLVGLAQQCLDEETDNKVSENQPSSLSSLQPVMLSSLREHQSDWQQLLESLGALYVRGFPIDWLGFDRDYQRHKITLPTYPFQRQRYWVKATPKQLRSEALHPLIDKLIKSPVIKEVLLETALSVETMPFLNDHRIDESVVVSGACYLAMLLSAAELAFKRSLHHLTDLFFPEVLVLGDAETRTTQIVFTPLPLPDSGPSSTFQLISFDGTTIDAERQPLCHATGTVGLLNKPEPEATALSTLQARCTRSVPLALDNSSPAATQQAQPLRLDPALRWIDAMWQAPENTTSSHGHEREVLLRLRRPATVDNLTGYLLHPGLLAACFQALVETDPATALAEELYLPCALAALRLYQAASGDGWWCYAKQVGELQWNLRLFDHVGQISAALDGLVLRAVPQTALHTARLRTDWLYTLAWEATPLVNPAPIQRQDCWLLFGATSGVSSALATALAATGTPTLLVTPGSEFSIKPVLEAGGVQQLTIDPTNPAMFKQLLSTVATQYQAVGLAYLWGMTSALRADDLPEESLRLCAGLLYLVQAVIEREIRVRLWVVTQACQTRTAASPIASTIAPNAPPADQQPAAGALWGLGRTIAFEHPQLACTCIDLQASDDVQQTQVLQQELSVGSTDTQTTEQMLYPAQILYQGDRRYVAHLRHWQPPARQQSKTLKGAGTYLITGGLEALGLHVAQQLVEAGASQLVLTSRHGVTTPEQRQQLAELEAAGAQITVLPADIANLSEAQQVIEQCTAIAPLRGLVHAAGVLADGVLTTQTLDHFAKVMRPKVNGAWHLHTLTQHLPLDFFVCFSSAAALLGSPGQSNYAAANAFLDTLMQQRQQAGLPGLSINWGPWAAGGMAAHVHERLNAQALTLLTPQQGKRLFQHLLNQPSAQIAVLPFKNGESAEQPLSQEQRFDWQAYQAMSSEERQVEITKRLCSLVASIGGFAVAQLDTQQSLLALGLDSLMTVQLRNYVLQNFHLAIPLSFLLDGSSIASLTSYLLDHLEESHLSPFTTSVHPGSSTPASEPSKPRSDAIAEHLAAQGAGSYQKVEGEL